MADQLLTGLRVLDLSREVSGALCAKLLGDYGADVVKLEPPEGDPVRRRGPFVGDRPGSDRSGLFWHLNANKRGIVLDLDTRAGQRVLRDLATRFDVVVESFAPGYLAERGLGYADLRGVNPRIILTSITPFGQTGPYRDFPATSFTLSAWSGWIYGTGEPDREPLRSGERFADYLAAHPALIATLGAYLGRDEAGGQWIDIAHLEAIEAAMMFATVASDYAGGILTARSGLRNPTASPYALHATGDGHLAVITYTPAQWEATARLMGLDDLVGDPALATRAQRFDQADRLDALMAPWIRARTKVEGFLAAQEAHLPFAYVANAADLLAMDQLRARGFWQRVNHPEAGPLTVPGPSFTVSEGGWAQRRPAPRLGEHTREVLEAELGLPPEDVVRLAAPARPAPTHRPTGDAFPTGNGRLPLAGIRIVDLTMFWAGPTIARYLAELGAEVIKVEAPRKMDPWRYWINAPVEPAYEASAGHNSANLNKLGITIDITTPAGKDLLHRLVRVSDAVVNNFSPRVMPRLGLDHDSLTKVKPDLVYVSAPGFGSSGPWRDFVAYAATVEALSGLNAQTGYRGGAPQMQLLAPGDPIAGFNAASALLMALNYRRRTGWGAWVDTSQVEALALLLPEPILDYQLNGRIAGPIGNEDQVFAPHGVYPCRGEDRWIAVAVTSDEQFTALAEAIGRTGLAGDPRFHGAAARWRNQAEVDAILAEWSRGQDQDAAARELLAAGVPAAPVYDNFQVSEDPHFRARDYFQSIDRAVVGPHRYPRTGMRLSGCEVGIRRPAPTFGQHNDHVFRDLLGLADPEIAALTAAGVIGDRPLVTAGG